MNFKQLLPSLFNISLFISLLTSCETRQQNETKLVDWIPQNTSIALQLNNPNEVENALKMALQQLEVNQRINSLLPGAALKASQ